MRSAIISDCVNRTDVQRFGTQIFLLIGGGLLIYDTISFLMVVSEIVRGYFGTDPAADAPLVDIIPTRYVAHQYTHICRGANTPIAVVGDKSRQNQKDSRESRLRLPIGAS
jgi:hypothetical protein